MAACSKWAIYANAGAIIERADGISREVRRAAGAISNNKDVASLSCREPLVSDAVSKYQQLAERLEKMDGELVTEQQLARNNNILGATYCLTFQKLRDACAASVHDLQGLRLSPEWGWLEKERASMLDDIASLYDEMDAESKRRPKFLGFTGD